MQLDNTQTEVERSLLCSRKCACLKIMFSDLWASQLSAAYLNVSGTQTYQSQA